MNIMRLSLPGPAKRIFAAIAASAELSELNRLRRLAGPAKRHRNAPQPEWVVALGREHLPVHVEIAGWRPLLMSIRVDKKMAVIVTSATRTKPNRVTRIRQILQRGPRV